MAAIKSLRVLNLQFLYIDLFSAVFVHEVGWEGAQCAWRGCESRQLMVVVEV